MGQGFTNFWCVALTLRFIVHPVHVLLDVPRFVSILKFNHEVWSIISPLPTFVLEDVDRIGLRVSNLFVPMGIFQGMFFL